MGYFRALVLTGSFLIVLGQMMLSLATEYYQVILAQAVCIGLGAGCLFVPSVAIISTYFNNTKIATAMGIAASGSSLGKLGVHAIRRSFADFDLQVVSSTPLSSTDCSRGLGLVGRRGSLVSWSSARSSFPT